MKLKWFSYIKKEYGGFAQHIAFDRAESPIAKLAAEFCLRWGMVAGVPDGEDSSGRQKLRLATPDELIDRAVTTVEKLYTVLDDRGHLVDTSETLNVLREAKEEDE